MYCHSDKSGTSHFYITTKESKIDTFSFSMHAQFHSSSFPFIQKKRKKKGKREKRSNNKKLNKEAGTLRINHVSYDIDTDLITKRNKE